MAARAGQPPVTPHQNGGGSKPAAAPEEASGSGHGTFQILVGRAVAVACGYAITVILARGLGPADYGIYGVVISVLTAVEMAAGLGIPAATTKLIPGGHAAARDVARTGSFLLVVGAVGLFALFWVLAPSLESLLGIPDGTDLFRIAFVDLPLTALVSAYQAALYGHRRFGVIGVSLALYAAAKLAGVLSLLVLGLSVGAALVVNAVGTLGAVVYLMLRVPTAGLWPSLPQFAPLLRLAMPIGLYTALAYVLYNVDLWILKGVGTTAAAAVGGYVAALNVARVLGIVTSALSPVVFASVCQALAQADETMARRHIQGAVRFALIALALASALVWFNGEDIMVTIYSQEYAGTGTLLGLQAVAFGALALMDPLLQASLAAGQNRWVVRLLAALIPLAVVANVILVGEFGAVGAAMGLAGTLGVGASGAIVMVSARFGSVVHVATLVRVLGATLIVATVDPWLDRLDLGLVVKLAFLVGLYGAVLAASGELRVRDLGVFVRPTSTT
jgi:O-antigen/teichoic acid export membrane protein